ncbi:hypothetical protein T4E_638 [Trichinella pseudospiralis]|uniref:Uncharacterized protein n=1 Tax=Trichinella pseudospiralis TaxID=6337 RepID=A0A0V0Y884_TRIPS|nr:hypothetical protein T4E_638 [Trichinella pseudospiralis]
MCSQKNNSLVCRCWRDQSVKIPSWNCPKFHRIRKTEHGNQNNAPAMNDRPPATTMRLYYTSREKRCGIWLRFTYRSCSNLARRKTAAERNCQQSRIFVTCDLTPSLLRFWDIKAMRITPEESVPKEDVKDLGKLEESLSFDGERYPVCFPWIPGHPDLPFNFNQARRQLIAVERHLKGCGKDSLDYLSPMRQYLDNSWTEAAPGPVN